MSDTNAAQTAPANASKPVEGIGGWLLVPPVYMALYVALTAAALVDAFAEGGAADLFSGAGPALPVAVAIGNMLFSTATAIFSLYGLVCIFKRKRDTPTLMIAFFVLIVLVPAADALSLWAVPILQTAPDVILDDGRAIGRNLTVAIVLITYFRASLRVKNTFVR